MPSFHEVDKKFYLLDSKGIKHAVKAVEVGKNGKCVNCIFGKSILTGFTRTFDCLSNNPMCTPDIRPDSKNIYYINI